MVSASRRGLALGTAVLILAVPVLFSPGAVGESANQAAIVVQHGNPTEGGAECVGFTEEQISGFDLVERSSFEYLAAQFDVGRAICWLDGEGCETTDPDECFCESPPNSWSLWVQGERDSVPDPSNTGVDDAAVQDGTVHYWVWGPFGEPPLQPTSVETVCEQAQEPEEPEPTSTPETVAPSEPTAPAEGRVESKQVPLPATR